MLLCLSCLPHPVSAVTLVDFYGPEQMYSSAFFLWLFKKRNIHSYLHAFSHFDGRQDGLALFEILGAVAPFSLKHTQSYRDPDSDAHLSILSCIAKKWLF